MIHLLVDGNALAHRLWFARAEGVPQRFVNAIGRLCIGHATPCELVAWDAPDSWRRVVFPAYKAGRRRKPPGLVEALAACKALSGLPHSCKDGYEADDLIANAARGAVAKGGWVLILANDKDLMQLVGPHCRLVDLRGKETGELEVLARYGVPPARIPYLLSWLGDDADGLPGVPGYGPKKAAEKANAGEVGSQITFQLCALGLVQSNRVWRARRAPSPPRAGAAPEVSPIASIQGRDIFALWCEACDAVTPHDEARACLDCARAGAAPGAEG